MKLDLNTVIFITGAGSGFGLECAIKYYYLGCSVILADLNYTKEAQDFIRKCQKTRIIVLEKFDVTNEDIIITGLAQAVEKFKHIDILVNSAGIATLGFTVTKSGKVVNNKDIWRMVQINVVGTINVSKHVAKHMINQSDRTDKVIINVASVAGLEGTAGSIGYSLSKGAVVGITLPMARDLGKYNIRVVTLAPQIFLTPMGNSNSPASNQKMLENTPIGRLGDSKEFADAVVNISESGYLTGCTIRLDGGIRVPHI